VIAPRFKVLSDLAEIDVERVHEALVDVTQNPAQRRRRRYESGVLPEMAA